MTTADKRKYIVYQWNQTHREPIDENAVALFLCDENWGNLTDEQRTFAKERCTEFEHCTRIIVYRILQCSEMMRQHLVSVPEEYCRIFLSAPITKDSRSVAACKGLCPALNGWPTEYHTPGHCGGFGLVFKGVGNRSPSQASEEGTMVICHQNK